MTFYLKHVLLFASFDVSDLSKLNFYHRILIFNNPENIMIEG